MNHLQTLLLIFSSPLVIGQSLQKDSIPTKIFLGLGSRNDYIYLSNITGYVDIISGETKMCSSYPGYPSKSVGATLFQGSYPLLCSGGAYVDERCMMLQDGVWTEVAQKNFNQQDAPAYVTVPNVGLWVLGGCCNGDSFHENNKTEILTEEGLWKEGPMITGSRTGHCAAQISDTQTFVYGGIKWDHEEGNYVNAEIYDWMTGAWTTSLDKTEERRHHTACGYHPLSGKVVIINGRYSDVLKVDLYDVESGKFSMGPELPHQMEGSQMITLGDRLFVLGGTSNTADDLNGNTKTIYEFLVDDDETMDWSKLNVTLPWEASNFLSFPITDEAAQANCV